MCVQEWVRPLTERIFTMSWFLQDQ